MENKTLSCVEKINGSFVFILRNRKEIQLNIGNRKDIHNHLIYYEMNIEQHLFMKDFDSNSVKNHCLLLPMLNPNGLPWDSEVLTLSCIYTIISDDWKDLDVMKKLS